MKSIIAFVCALLFASSTLFGQQLPNVTLEDIDGNQINTSEFLSDSTPVIISFWAIWCKPCIMELKNIHEVYEDWQEETGVRMIAIAIDDNRTVHAVKPRVISEGWEFEVYLDKNQAFKRAMNVNYPPHTFLYDQNGNLIYQHNQYSPGDEEELYDHVLELTEEAEDKE